MRKQLMAVSMAVVMAASLAACGGSSQSSSSTTAGSGGQESTGTSQTQSGSTSSGSGIVIKLCHTDPSGCATTEALQRFAKEVTEESGGRLTIEEYADGIMGDDDVVNEQIYNGAMMMNYSDPGLVEPYYADYSILMCPYFYESPDEIAEFKETDFNKKLAAGLKDAGIMVLDNFGGYYGSRQIMSKKQISSPDDVKGLNFRVPNQATQIEMVEGWGANPTTIAFSETYSALQQGVVDCVENPIGSLYANSMQEVCDYLNITNHFYAVNGLIMSAQVYDSLDPDLQELLVTKANEFDEYNKEMVEAEEEEDLKAMEEEGTTINRDVDIEAMKVTKDYVLEHHGWSQDLIDEAQAALEEIRQ